MGKLDMAYPVFFCCLIPPSSWVGNQGSGLEFPGRIPKNRQLASHLFRSSGDDWGQEIQRNHPFGSCIRAQLVVHC